MSATNPYPVVGAAEWRVMQEFRAFASSMPESEMSDFFDSRNRSVWMDAFARFLLERNKKMGTSND